MRCALLLALAACNGILGLGDVVERPPVDAQQFDMMPDAPASCPTGAAPQYRSALHQLPMTPACYFTSVAETGDVMSLCNSEPYFGTVATGLAKLVFAPATSLALHYLRIAPEGDFAIGFGSDVSGNTTVALRRNADDTWRVEGALNIQPSGGILLSNPSRLVLGQRLMLLVDSVGGTASQYTGDGMTWTPTGLTFPIALQSYLVPISLTADALHFVMVGGGGSNVGTYYFERGDPTQPFSAGLFIATVPRQGDDPFMTNDCGRIYFDALQTVLWVEQ